MDPDLDVPAGDIGVGAREIDTCLVSTKELEMNLLGFNWKRFSLGGSLIRPEATQVMELFIYTTNVETRGEFYIGRKKTALSLWLWKCSMGCGVKGKWN